MVQMNSQNRSKLTGPEEELLDLWVLKGGEASGGAGQREYLGSLGPRAQTHTAVFLERISRKDSVLLGSLVAGELGRVDACVHG